MNRTIALILSLATVGTTLGCGDSSRPPAGPTLVFATAPDFTGIWIGVSRVSSCEPSGAGCASYPTGHERYLNFRLTQRAEEVTGNVSPSPGGPTALPAVFWIAGRLTSGKLTFEPMDMPGASGGLTSFSGEVMTTVSSPAEMLGRMTERTSHNGDPLTITWEVRTIRQ